MELVKLCRWAPVCLQVLAVSFPKENQKTVYEILIVSMVLYICEFSSSSSFLSLSQSFPLEIVLMEVVSL